MAPMMEIQSPTVADVSPESSRMLALLKNKNSLTPIPANEMIPAAEEIKNIQTISPTEL